ERRPTRCVEDFPDVARRDRPHCGHYYLAGALKVNCLVRSDLVIVSHLPVDLRVVLGTVERNVTTVHKKHSEGGGSAELHFTHIELGGLGGVDVHLQSCCVGVGNAQQATRLIVPLIDVQGDPVLERETPVVHFEGVVAGGRVLVDDVE